jgi:hypothetical protein
MRAKDMAGSGPNSYWSPRHRVQFDLRDEGRKCDRGGEGGWGGEEDDEEQEEEESGGLEG